MITKQIGKDNSPYICQNTKSEEKEKTKDNLQGKQEIILTTLKMKEGREKQRIGFLLLSKVGMGKLNLMKSMDID